MIVLSKIKKLIDIFNSEGMTGVTNKIKSKAEYYRLEKIIDRCGTRLE